MNRHAAGLIPFFTGAQIESPSMQRANDAAMMHKTVGKGAAFVWADMIDSEDFACHLEQCDLPTVDDDAQAFSLLKVAEQRYCGE